LREIADLNRRAKIMFPKERKQNILLILGNSILAFGFYEILISANTYL
jgi:hypothetical protein